MDVDIDLREDMLDMIKSFGMPVLIQRSSNIFPCTCSYKKKEQLFGNSEDTCNLCNNTGKVIKLEKHKGIKCEHNPETFNLTEIGIKNDQLSDYYFEYVTPLKDNDLIFEVGWKEVKVSQNVIDTIPITLINIYRIKNALPIKGTRGRAEYNVALCQKENIDITKIQQTFIRNFKYYNRNFFLQGEII